MLCSCVRISLTASKHLSLNNPKTNAELSDRSGIRFEPARGIYRVLYYVVCDDPSDEYHGMEVRILLRCCRDEWQGIINRHYLTRVYDDLQNLRTNGSS